MAQRRANIRRTTTLKQPNSNNQGTAHQPSPHALTDLHLSPVIPASLHRHSRVGGNLQGGARCPRHCGLDPQSRGEDWAAVILALRQYPQGGVTTRQTNQSPSHLMGEDQSLSQCLTREQRVKNDALHRPNPENPPHRHSRVGGPFIRTRTIWRLRLCAASAHAGTA